MGVPERGITEESPHDEPRPAYAMNILKKPILMLVINDGDALERMLTLFRSREPMADVVGAETSEKALDWMAHHPVDAVASDEHLGDMSGVDLLNRIKMVNSEITAIILTTPGDSSLYHMSKNMGAAHCIVKTTDLEKMVTDIASHLFQEEVGFRGILDNLELPDIIQLLCLRQETKQVRITSDMHSGVIMIENGRVVHARTQSKQGEEAFYDLFAWKGGGFQLQALQKVPKHTIQRPWESLLLEAGQLLDEESHAEEEAAAPTPGPAPALDEQPVAMLPAPDPPPEVPADAEKTVVEERAETEETTDLENMPGVVVVGTRHKGGALDVYDPAAKSNADPEVRLENLWSAKAISGKAPAKAPHTLSKAVMPERERKPGPQAAPQRKRDTLAEARRVRRWRSARKAVAGVFIATMLVPVVVMLGLAIPWLWKNTEMEVHLKRVIPKELLLGARAKNDTLAAVAVEPEPMPNEWADEPGVCHLHVVQMKEFARSGNIVAVSRDVFARLALEENPWVELMTPGGLTIGAMAIETIAPPSTVYVRRTMATALNMAEGSPAYVNIRPVELNYDLADRNELAFTATRPLADAYCEYWYAVGIGLTVMQEANLTPGSYAIAKGPSGYQSVQIQVMDRGNPDEIWLGERVRDAIGATDSRDRVVLYPKDPLEAAGNEQASAQPVE